MVSSWSAPTGNGTGTVRAAVAFSVVLLASLNGIAAADTTKTLMTQLAQHLSGLASRPVKQQPVSSPVLTQAGEPDNPLKSRDVSTEGRLIRRSCGVEPLSMKEMAMQEVRLKSVSRLMASEDSGNASGGGLGQRATPDFGPLVKKVNIYWHVIRKGSRASEGSLSLRSIDAQIDVLNERYRKANVRFQLADVDYTTNKEWYNVKQGSDTDSEMRRALHRGSMKDLNVYSAKPLGTAGDLIAGYTKMPQFALLDTALDGSVLLHTTLPGGSEPKFNLGLTLVHEIGHAFGLMHPFDHGCNFPGDAVGDTVYQREAIYTCTPQKTCPNKPGHMDPIHNPMGYAPDGCMKSFTKMQTKKIRSAWYAYRYSAK